MAGFIEFNYEKALRQADKLDEIAERIKQLSDTSMSETLETLQLSWQGYNAATFVSKGMALKEKSIQTAKDLNKTAEKIRTIATKIYLAEKAAVDIATRRSY